MIDNDQQLAVTREHVAQMETIKIRNNFSRPSNKWAECSASSNPNETRSSIGTRGTSPCWPRGRWNKFVNCMRRLTITCGGWRKLQRDREPCCGPRQSTDRKSVV